MMKVYASTRKGKGKSHSEDRIVIDNIVLNDENRLFENISPKIIGVSDGVGGNAGGELASQFVCERAESLTDDNVLEKTAILNTRLLEYASGIKGRERMAATFSAVIFSNDGIEPDRFVHIGNTRIYTVQGGYLKQITNDHTTYNALIYRGFYDLAERCNRNEINACFGGGTVKLFDPDIAAFSGFAKFIFTSDGIHDFLEIDDMEEIICSGTGFEEICRNLMQKALDNGSCDDMSIIIAEI